MPSKPKCPVKQKPVVPRHPLTHRLVSEAECQSFLKQLVSDGYRWLTIEDILRVAAQVHKGTYCVNDVVALMLSDRISGINQKITISDSTQ